MIEFVFWNDKKIPMEHDIRRATVNWRKPEAERCKKKMFYPI